MLSKSPINQAINPKTVYSLHLRIFSGNSTPLIYSFFILSCKDTSRNVLGSPTRGVCSTALSSHIHVPLPKHRQNRLTVADQSCGGNVTAGTKGLQDNSLRAVCLNSSNLFFIFLVLYSRKLPVIRTINQWFSTF
jgi:hypothetical protein